MKEHRRISEAPQTIQPIGGGQEVRLIDGLDGVLRTTAAAAQEMTNVSRELHILNERSAQMYGVYPQSGTAPTPRSDQRDVVAALHAAIGEQTKAILASLPQQASAAG